MAERWRTPFASSEAVHQKMSTLARRDTGPELALRRALHRRGLRYRVHRRPLPGLSRQADIVFTGAKVAVFVDGCFWHGCPEHGRREHRTNGWYWPSKIETNKDRDRDTDERLIAAGWVPVRVWEHEDPQEAADRVADTVRQEVTANTRTRASGTSLLAGATSRRFSSRIVRASPIRIPRMSQVSRK